MRRVLVQGHTLNVRTAKMLHVAEQRLGFSLVVIQGSYNAGGVSASAGTHDGGGAVDVSAAHDPARVVRVLREVGFAAWHRLPSQGPWTEHIHAIAIGDPELSSGARLQVSEYYSRQNGLANHAPDDGPRLNPIPRWPLKFSKVLYLVVANQFGSKNPKSRFSVKAVQRSLNHRGHTLVVDGIAGPKTRAGYAGWLKHKGHDPKKGVTRATLKELVAGYYRVL